MLGTRYEVKAHTNFGRGKAKAVTMVIDAPDVEDARRALRLAVHFGCIEAPDGTKITVPLTDAEISAATYREVWGVKRADGLPRAEIVSVTGLKLSTVTRRYRSADQSAGNVLP